MDEKDNGSIINKEEIGKGVETVSREEFDKIKLELDQAKFTLANNRIENKKEKSSLFEEATKLAQTQIDTYIINTELRDLPENEKNAVLAMAQKLNVQDVSEKIRLAKKLAINDDKMKEMEQKALEKVKVEENKYSSSNAKPTINPNNPQVDPAKEALFVQLKRMRSQGQKHLANLSDEDLRKQAYTAKKFTK